jgi:hypothetical protein
LSNRALHICYPDDSIRFEKHGVTFVLAFGKCHHRLLIGLLFRVASIRSQFHVLSKQNVMSIDSRPYKSYNFVCMFSELCSYHWMALIQQREDFLNMYDDKKLQQINKE